MIKQFGIEFDHWFHDVHSIVAIINKRRTKTTATTPASSSSKEEFSW